MSISAFQFNGEYDFTFPDGTTSTILIDGNKVTVKSCDFACNDIKEGSLVNSDDQTNYPTADGWMKIPQIYRSDIYMHIRLKSDGNIAVKYKEGALMTGVNKGDFDFRIFFFVERQYHTK